MNQSFHRRYLFFNRTVLTITAVCLLACGCGSDRKKDYTIPTTQGTRDNRSECLVPEAPGTKVFRDKTYSVDYSNAADGYIMAKYTGSAPKVKLQITLPDQTVYTYNVTSDDQSFPLSSDSGDYSVGIYENVTSNEYAAVMFETFSVQLQNTYGAYLYPNQYVNFKQGDDAVVMGEKLAYSANDDLDVISNVYNYMISNISYDTKEADTVTSGYLPDVDRTLSSKKGICLDYASLMAAMLRSQKIPTHMEVGYAGTLYHAWISTYIKDVGWVNGIIQFDGKDWQLMDPTFGASTGEKKLKKYIGDGSNYTVKYIY